jgi:transcriptional regulator with XRE-family HTH domain
MPVDHLPMMDLFAGELRRLRQLAGLSQEALAEQVSYSASLVAAVEQCRRPPRLDFVERCDTVPRTDGLLVRIREAITRESLMPWFREWVSIEREAGVLRSFEPLVGRLPWADCPHDRGEGGGMDLTGAVWHKSTRSSGNSGNCVEVADNLPDVVGVRDSKDRQGPVLIFDRAVWAQFVASLKP